MGAEHAIVFGPFRLDLADECLWCGEEVVELRPKAFAVLRYLVEHAGRLVTKDELLDAVWPETAVVEAVLKVRIHELREALQDNPATPRFIETVHRRGYRFVAPVTTAPPVPSSKFQVPSFHTTPAPSAQYLASPLVGRAPELERLLSCLGKALQGQRQVLLVTGEAGIGKTTVIEALLDHVTKSANVQIVRGQCVEHYGTSEAYLPVLEALGRLCRQAEGEAFVRLLRQYAPTWLLQLPWLLSPAEREVLQREMFGITQERMLREMAEAVEAFTVTMPLILTLEDLHWSDYSTLDLFARLARRQEPCRLLLIGTYRPVEVIVSDHPVKRVKQELTLQRRCEEIELELLTEGEVEEYLARRFPMVKNSETLFPLLAKTIHRRTDGNPLFMTAVVDSLITQGRLVQQQAGLWELQDGAVDVAIDAPANIRQMIEQQVERLGAEEWQILEAGSVTGIGFSTATIAGALEIPVAQVETRCEALARRGQFLRPLGLRQWPDGTAAGHYEFSHALYQDVLYEGISAERRLRLHQRIGEHEEVTYGNRAGEVAAELAVHFERGLDYRRAVQYLAQAAETAVRRSAHREAIAALTRGLELLQNLPDSLERLQQELRLQLALGVPLIATKGYAAVEVERAYVRARELCTRIGDTPLLFPVLWGSWGFLSARGELQAARELAEQGLDLAQRMQDSTFLLDARLGLGVILYYLGELVAARDHLRQGAMLFSAHHNYSDRFHTFVQDSGVECLAYEAHVLWLLGYPDQALDTMHQALALAQQIAHPFRVAYTLDLAAGLRWLRREVLAVQEHAEAAVALSVEQGFPLWTAMGTILQGCVLSTQSRAEEGIAQIRQGLGIFQATGAGVARAFFLALLAEAYGKKGQIAEGQRVLAEALAIVHKNGECFYEAELYRLKGELLLNAEREMMNDEFQKPSSSRDRGETQRLLTALEQQATKKPEGEKGTKRQKGKHREARARGQRK